MIHGVSKLDGSGGADRQWWLWHTKHCTERNGSFEKRGNNSIMHPSKRWKRNEMLDSFRLFLQESKKNSSLDFHFIRKVREAPFAYVDRVTQTVTA